MKNSVLEVKNNSLPILACSSVSVVYKSQNGLYRGFVQPYDITYEANTHKKVLEVLNEMVLEYEEGLRKYDHPSHLLHIPLSDQEDKEKLNDIAPHLFGNLLNKNYKIITPNYYAEAKLPA